MGVTPDDSLPPGERRSILDTVGEVVADASGLVQAEARLARAETAGNMRGLVRSVATMAAGLMLLMLSLVFLTVAGVIALSAWVGLIGALLVVALVCVLGGVLLARAGLERMATQKLLPEESLRRVSNDLSWLSHRARPVQTEGEMAHEAP